MKLLHEYMLLSSQNPILNDRRYITEVLCIDIPLHESYPFSSELQSRILYEHMLLEGFWSDIKDMAGDTKRLFASFKEVATDPNRLSSLSSMVGKASAYPIKQLYKLLNTIIEKLSDHADKFPTFVEWAKKLKSFMDGLQTKVKSADGWKGLITKTSFGLAIKFLWDNVGEFVEKANDGLGSLLKKLKDDLVGDQLDELMDKAKDFLKEFLTPVIDWVKEKFKSLAGKLMTQFSGIGAWFDWAKTAFNGAKFVLGFLTPALKKFTGETGIKLRSENLIREYIRVLLKEDAIGFVHDLIGSKNFEDFDGGEVGKAGARDIKRVFAKNADYQFLNSLDTVHWTDPYSLEPLIGKNKDELSATMTLPGENFIQADTGDVGLWIKGRITLAANDQDEIFSGHMRHYGDTTDPKVRHRDRSSGRNKLPTKARDYSMYDAAERGNEKHEKLVSQKIPYVLDRSTWNPSQTRSYNEALVDNWKPVGIVVTDNETIGIVSSLSYITNEQEANKELLGSMRRLVLFALKLGIPIYNDKKDMLWSPK